MLILRRRLQVLIDDERYERLQSESERVGAPVGEIVRRAIDCQFPPSDGDARAAAAERLLALADPAGSGPEPDWETQKRELLDGQGSG
jgi:hypothetical protein